MLRVHPPVMPAVPAGVTRQVPQEQARGEDGEQHGQGQADAPVLDVFAAGREEQQGREDGNGGQGGQPPGQRESGRAKPAQHK
jgi:hypothetical protein